MKKSYIMSAYICVKYRMDNYLTHELSYADTINVYPMTGHILYDHHSLFVEIHLSTSQLKSVAKVSEQYIRSFFNRFRE